MLLCPLAMAIILIEPNLIEKQRMTMELITRSMWRALPILCIPPPAPPLGLLMWQNLLCPLFLIKLSSAAFVHIRGSAPSGLRSIRLVREQSSSVIRVGDTWEVKRRKDLLRLDLKADYQMMTWDSVYPRRGAKTHAEQVNQHKNQH